MSLNRIDDLREKGTKILTKVEKYIKDATNNCDEQFYLNRYVFARLQLKERKKKTVIKKDLYSQYPNCHFCNKSFSTNKGVEIHRKNTSRGYS